MPTQPELKTIHDVIHYAANRFDAADLYYGHGTDNAWDEACALVLDTLHLPHSIQPQALNAHITPMEYTALLNLIEKRITQKIPVPYLTHEAWFGNLSFYIDERVLIPRSPLAELIENQFAPWIIADDVENILDLCTGSACIAIACANVFPQAKIAASDISSDALAVAKINLLRHAVQEQITLYQSDLFAALPQKKYDVIVSNPPYVSTEEMIALPREYQHEPKLALAAGNDGLTFVTRILHNAHRYLTPRGILIVEVGNSEIALAEKFPMIPFVWLEFERGGDGVFLLTAEQLMKINCT